MLFNSAHFLLFFPVVALLYFAIPSKFNCARIGWLLVSSYYFYMCWNVVYALLMLGSTVVTYLCGRLIGYRRDKAKWFLVASLVINFGILFFFKYQGFAANTITRVLSAIGIAWKVPTFEVLLPVGISFYTFQAVGYTIDVYRGDIEPEKNIVNYALFVSFFPQLVAGPIERSGNLLHQIKAKHRFDYERVRSGLWLMLWGFFQKLVLADRLASVVDLAYGKPESQTALRLILATIAFAFQIYCDFASYSNIAIGAARIFGIRLMKNFDRPYFSCSIAEFWRRWHISLSSWLKDYIYIPLGGNRRGSVRKYVNLIIVFLVSGLWHGASWNFVIWGAIHGVYQIVGDITKPFRDRLWKWMHLDVEGWFVRLVRGGITFVLVDFAWIFFRASGTAGALRIIKRILIPGSVSENLAQSPAFGKDLLWWIVTGCALLVLLAVSVWEGRAGKQDRHGRMILSPDARFAAWPLVLRWAVCLLLLFAILLFGVWDTGGFIYFQF